MLYIRTDATTIIEKMKISACVSRSLIRPASAKRKRRLEISDDSIPAHINPAPKLPPVALSVRAGFSSRVCVPLGAVCDGCCR